MQKIDSVEGVLENFPNVNSPIHKRIGYHLRDGKHDVTDYDWFQYIKFANKHFN